MRDVIPPRTGGSTPIFSWDPFHGYTYARGRGCGKILEAGPAILLIFVWEFNFAHMFDHFKIKFGEISISFMGT